MTQKLVGLAEGAKSLGISYWGFWRATKDGTIRSVRCGRRRMIPVEELERISREGFTAAPQKADVPAVDFKSLAAGDRD